MLKIVSVVAAGLLALGMAAASSLAAPVALPAKPEISNVVEAQASQDMKGKKGQKKAAAKKSQKKKKGSGKSKAKSKQTS